MKRHALLLCLLAALALTSCAAPAPEEGLTETEGDAPGYHSGGQVSVTRDGVEEALAKPEELDRDIAHEPAPEPQTVEDPVSGYCGNTITEVTLDGETWSFWGGDSVTLTDIVINLDYADGVCRCMPEFTVDTEFGDGYGVNLTNSYVRHEGGQAPLTAEQTETIQDILDRNCK